MIKAKVSTDYKDIERIFAGGSIQKEILKVWSTEADEYVFEAWKILEMEGPLPLSIRANGEPLIDYRIYGNTIQNGTPTPENPITPIGCGERTENLCDENNINQGYYAYADGQYGNIGTWVNTYYIAIKGATEYTAKFKTIYNRSRWYGFVWYDSNKQYISTTNTQDNQYECELTAISPANASFCVFNICSQNTTSGLKPSDVIYFMLNTGSTALPYEPYGYKLPILSNSTVTNIYLGEVETTRRIKKLVLTGGENWSRQSISHTTCINLYATITSALPNGMIISNIATYHSNAGQNNDSIVNVGRINNIGNNLLMDMDLSDFTTSSDWKSYLAAQYAAGTPVTVWYVLAEPETGIVNEPLMKIGDYADTIDNTQTSVQIPTSKGTTTIDYDGEDHFITSDGYELVDKNQNGFLLSGSTLRPSKMYIKYKGR